MGITASSVFGLQARKGLPLLNQISGWAVLGNQLVLYNPIIIVLSVFPSDIICVPFCVACQASYLLLEVIDVLPRLWTMLRNPLDQCRRLVLSLLFGDIDPLGRG